MPISARLIVNPGALKLKRDAVKPLIDALARASEKLPHERAAGRRRSPERAAAGAALPAHGADGAAIRELDTGAAGFDAALEALIRFEAGQDPRSTRRSRRSSPTCARAATPRCSNTRGASTASTPRRQALTIDAAAMRAAHDALPAPQRDALAQRRRASARTTSAEVAEFRFATPTAPSSGSA
jgi:hypothetical protein